MLGASKKQKPSRQPAKEAELSLDQCLAKTWKNKPGRTVREHACITKAVTRVLLERLPECVRKQIPPKSENLCGGHDVGKIEPCFQSGIYENTDENLPTPALKSYAPDLQKVWGWHWSVSYAAFRDIDLRLAEVAGWHHGRPPTKNRPDDGFSFGGEPWRALRKEFLREISDGGHWPVMESDDQCLLLKGLTAVADWISSGSRFDDPAEDWRPLVDEAVTAAGFGLPAIRHGLSFQDIFHFPPRHIQSTLAQCASAPGIYVVEAGMGEGKTEAALFAAYQMLDRNEAGGIYFALPTQLTSNKIQERVDAFLSRILEPGSAHSQSLLLHGNAWLRHFQRQEMGEDAAPGGSWFDQGKRGLLAPFAVGTIDQALMAVIQVRHAAVRAFGLAGKVVILDEVHSYDVYTGTLLDILIGQLRHLRCTVILLSATLTRERIAKLTTISPDTENAYPCITAILGNTVQSHPCTAEDNPQNTVALRCGTPEREAVEEALLRADGGQQVLWIENTVAEAQERYRELAARSAALGIPAGLLHSRFTAADREKRETLWTGYFGKNSPNRAESGRILVGTQVLEQSLDLDADFLVTRLCPTDMLFQRMGRLWRHPTARRPSGARREVWILSPGLADAEQNPRRAFGPSGAVYSPYVLVRTLELWQDRTEITLPEDIRPLLEATYREREETSPPLCAARRELEKLRERLTSLALSSRGDQLVDEQTASTRAVSVPTVPVLILKRWSPDLREAVTLDETIVHLPARTSPWHERASASAALQRSMVNVPLTQLAEAGRLPAAVKSMLSPCLYTGRDDAEFPALLLALRSEAGTLSTDAGLPFPGTYSSTLGYCRQRQS